MCLDFWNVSSKILIFFHLLKISTSSNCDVEFTYSEFYNSNGFKVTCSDIEEGQEDIIRYITAQNAIILDIKNTTLVNVTSDLFGNVPKIKELNIEDSVISVDGSVDLFSKLENLQTLIMKNTVMKEVGNGTFQNLHEIRTLHLENNNLSLISKDSLKLYSLDSLLFINNNLENVDDIPLCLLDNIEKINLSWNKIKTLKPGLYNCIPEKTTKSSVNSLFRNNYLAVEYLDLSNNQINTIKNAFSSVKNLNFLNLANNSITRITDADFSNLSELEELNLSNNSLDSLSTAAFSNLINLRKIDLSYNKITELQIHLLTKLSEINLSHNKLTFDSLEGIKFLPFLEILDLSYNELNGSSEFFNNFPLITKLNLNGNKLYLEDGTFTNLSHLEFLYLQDNDIYNLPEKIFKNMKSLRELDLSKNKLEVLDNYEVFSSLFSLQVFNLSYNNLRYLNHNLFSNLDDCEILDIAGNKLKELDYPYIINSMRSLETINLKENLFSCNFLHKLVRYFSWKNIQYIGDNTTQYDVENIGGIHCQEDVNYVEPVQKNTGSTSVFVTALIGAILSVFILLVILLIKYYQIYKRSKYHSEQFELISD